MQKYSLLVTIIAFAAPILAAEHGVFKTNQLRPPCVEAIALPAVEDSAVAQNEQSSIAAALKDLFLKEAPDALYMITRIDGKDKWLYLKKGQAALSSWLINRWEKDRSVGSQKNPLRITFDVLFDIKNDGSLKNDVTRNDSEWCINKWLRLLEMSKDKLAVIFLTMPLVNVARAIRCSSVLEIAELRKLAIEKFVARVKQPLDSLTQAEIEQIRAEFWQIKIALIDRWPDALKKELREAFFTSEDQLRVRSALFTDFEFPQVFRLCMRIKRLLIHWLLLALVKINHS